jgi:hypothetical protein
MAYTRPAVRLATDRFGYEGYSQLRAAILASVFARQPIGGSRQFTVEGTGWQDAHDAIPFTVPDNASAGATYKVDVWLKSADGVTTIQPRIQNITDNTTAVTGTAEDATTFTKQTLAFVPQIGKEYRLQFLKSDDDAPCWGFGILQRTDGTDTDVIVVPPASAAVLVTGEAFTGDGAETDFVLAHAPTGGSVAVYVNGVRVSSWTLADDTITFDAAPALDDEILVDYAY